MQRDINKGVGHKESRGRGNEARYQETRDEKARSRKVRCGGLRDCTREKDCGRGM